MPRTCSQVGFQPVIPLPDGTVDSVSEVVFEEDPASWQHCRRICFESSGSCNFASSRTWTCRRRRVRRHLLRLSRNTWPFSVSPAAASLRRTGGLCRGTRMCRSCRRASHFTSSEAGRRACADSKEGWRTWILTRFPVSPFCTKTLALTPKLCQPHLTSESASAQLVTSTSWSAGVCISFWKKLLAPALLSAQTQCQCQCQVVHSQH